VIKLPQSSFRKKSGNISALWAFTRRSLKTIKLSHRNCTHQTAT